jgi:hypothetical protein
VRFHPHPNGFVQVPLKDGARLNLFSDGFPRPATAGPTHDHRFEFESTVLRGRMVHVPVSMVATPNGSHRVWYEDSPGDLEAGPRCVVWCDLRPLLVSVGETYAVRIGELHQAYAIGDTATLVRVTRRDPAYRARVVYHAGTLPVGPARVDAKKVRGMIDALHLWDTIQEHGGTER